MKIYLCGVLLLAATQLCVCCGGFGSKVQERAKEIEAREKGRTAQVGEWVTEGDLSITVSNISRRTVSILVQNNSQGKVANWRVWEVGEVKDEHGNSFGPDTLPGPDWLPRAAVSDQGGFHERPEGLRVDPQKRRSLGLFHELLPETSHQATVVTKTPNGPITWTGDVRER